MTILQSLFSEFTTDRLIGIADNIGEKPRVVQRAMGAALTAIMGATISKGANESGSANLLRLMREQNIAPHSLHDVDQIFEPGQAQERARDSGGAILGALFGPKVPEAATAVENFAGLKSDSAKLLMGLAAPIVFGSLAKRAPPSGFSPNGLSSLLADQKQSLARLTPPRIGHVLKTMPGISDLDFARGRRRLRKVTRKRNVYIPPAPPKRTAAAYAAATKTTAVSSSGVHHVRPRGPSWLPKLLLALIPLFFLVLGLRACTNQGPDTVIRDPARTTLDAPLTITEPLDVPAPQPEATPVEPTQPSETTQPATETVQERNPLASMLAWPEGSFEWELQRYLQSDEPTPRVFILRNLNFETASDQLTEDSQVAIARAITVLDNFPNVKLRIEGHTDNRGRYSFNQELSRDRAQAVADMMISAGINESRIQAVGYGPDRPMSDNNTDEGRRENRRVQMMVTEK